MLCIVNEWIRCFDLLEKAMSSWDKVFFSLSVKKKTHLSNDSLLVTTKYKNKEQLIYNCMINDMSTNLEGTSS